MSRPITADEIALIQATLQRAPLDSTLAAATTDLATLVVVDRCACGCPSVDFEKKGQAPPARPVADGIGTTAAGTPVGVIVWGRDRSITGLEVYDLAGRDQIPGLPRPDSIEPFPATSG